VTEYKIKIICDKNNVYRIYFTHCMNIFNSLLAQLVKYDVHTTRKINSIHAIFYHILTLSGLVYAKCNEEQE